MEALIVDAVRTPRGLGRVGKGALNGVHPQELLVQTLRQLESRTGVDPAAVDDLVVGCVSQFGEQGANVARNAVLAAGWPETVGGVTLNRFCGSGLQAVAFGAMGVGSGAQELVVAGGVESMSRVPMGSDQGGIDGNNLRLRETLVQVPQGISADLLATLEGYTREELDAFALESQRRAAGAPAALFAVRGPGGEVLLDRDEHPRAGTTLEGLSALEPAFAKLGAMAVGPAGETLDELARRRYPQVEAIRHLHTAGNSSGIVDGAALVLLASPAAAQARGLKARARVRALAVSGAEPVVMLTGPLPATRKALKAAGMSAGDIDLWEINEAFAAVVLKVIREFGLDPAKVNVNGGAIALGHPLGATGAVLLGTALDELERRGLGTALVTLCIGGGQGIAMIVERC